MAFPITTWWVYHINCDCCSYNVAYTYKPRWKVGPRCRYCRHRLGWMSFSFTCKVKARTEFEAVKKMHEWWKAQMASKLKTKDNTEGREST